MSGTTAASRYEVLLNSDKRTFAPGDDVWVTVQLKARSGQSLAEDPTIFGGSVALVGEERTTLVGGSMHTSSIFDPILVYLESGVASTMWRINLKLPNDIPPSCDLGAIPPCGIVLYVLTARLQIPGTGNASQPLVGSKRIRVVSTASMSQMKAADVTGNIVDNTSPSLCCFGTPNVADPRASSAGLKRADSGVLSKTAPEFRVQVLSKTSFRCGEHLKYRVTVRGQGPNGKSLDRKFNRIDGLRIWIRRQRWFTDGKNEATTSDAAKQPQIVDFTGSAAGVLPMDYDSNISIPLGIAPTARGSILSNEYDLVVELLISGRQCGVVEIPITVWRDAEGNFLLPSFSPNLQAVKLNVDHTHVGDGTAHGVEDSPYEKDEEQHGGARALENMQQLALA